LPEIQENFTKLDSNLKKHYGDKSK